MQRTSVLYAQVGNCWRISYQIMTGRWHLSAGPPLLTLLPNIDCGKVGRKVCAGYDGTTAVWAFAFACRITQEPEVLRLDHTHFPGSPESDLEEPDFRL